MMVMMALVAKAPAPKILHPLAGEVVDVQQRLPPLGISLDPLAELQMGRKMAAKKLQGVSPSHAGGQIRGGIRGDR